MTKATGIVVVAAILVFAALIAALEPSPRNEVPNLIYHPAPPPVELIKTAFRVGRASATHDLTPSPRPPIKLELGSAIYKQVIGGEIQDSTLFGWDLSFAEYNEGHGEIEYVNYSVIATQKGAQEYYYSVLIENTRGSVKVSATPPVVMLICADNSLIPSGYKCDDGSMPKPFVRQ
ncbi:MAG TPA: hypothetical protein VIJ29_03945 [Candidatus Paceibacterota bacterium]